MRRGDKFLAGVVVAALVGCSGENGKLEIRSTAVPPSAVAKPVPLRIAEARGQLAIGNVALALESFRKASREDPTSTDALLGMATCYDRMGRYDLSRRNYEAALAIAPADVELLAALAGSLEMQGLKAEALKVRREAAARAVLAVPSAAVESAQAAVATAPTAKSAASVAPAIKRVEPMKPAAPAQLVQTPRPRPVPPSVAAAAPAPAAAPARAPVAVAATEPAPVAPPTREPAVIAAAERAPAAAPAPVVPVSVAAANPVPPAAVAKPTPVSAAPAARLAEAAPVGPSVTIKLPPPRPVEQPAVRQAEAPAPEPAKPTPVPVPEPPAQHAVAAAGPRLERLSIGEIALLTTPAPIWRSTAVAEAASRPAVRWVPLREASASPAKVRILNAARVNRLAARTRAWLVARGWSPMGIGDAPVTQAQSVIVYPRGQRALAKRLSNQFGFAMEERSDTKFVTMLLGRDAARIHDLRSTSA
jgi:Tfp pilus assembly protein PilF